MKLFFSFFSIVILSATISNPSVIEISNKQHFQQTVTENPKAVVVQFAADWCGVCQTVKEPFNALAEDPEFNDISFVRVNIDSLADISQEHNIMGVPTFLYVQNGKTIDQKVGVQDMGMFQEDMRKDLRSSFNLLPITRKEKSPVSPSATEQQEGLFKKIQSFFIALGHLIMGFFHSILAIFQ